MCMYVRVCSYLIIYAFITKTSGYFLYMCEKERWARTTLLRLAARRGFIVVLVVYSLLECFAL